VRFEFAIWLGIPRKILIFREMMSRAELLDYFSVDCNALLNSCRPV